MLDVRAVGNVVSGFIRVLQESDEARKVVESWGLDVEVVLKQAEAVESVVVDLLAEGMEVL